MPTGLVDLNNLCWMVSLFKSLKSFFKFTGTSIEVSFVDGISAELPFSS